MKGWLYLHCHMYMQAIQDLLRPYHAQRIANFVDFEINPRAIT